MHSNFRCTHSKISGAFLHIPTYTLFTNEQLAEMVQRRVQTETTLHARSPGIGCLLPTLDTVLTARPGVRGRR